jgi:EpsI family protein
MAMLMVAGAAGAWMATPSRRVADMRPRVDLAHIVPAAFGDWRIDTSIVPVQVAPGVQKELDALYGQTLARTYVNPHGEQVMLVLAYGRVQDDTLAVHKPDICYPAQGFEIIKTEHAMFDTGFGALPVTRLVARQPRRHEPLTYWIRVGDVVDGTATRRKLTQLKYGMTGMIPDGLLFRVSSFGAEDEAFPLQARFARALLAALDPAGRAVLAGRLSGDLAVPLAKQETKPLATAPLRD